MISRMPRLLFRLFFGPVLIRFLFFLPVIDNCRVEQLSMTNPHFPSPSFPRCNYIHDTAGGKKKKKKWMIAEKR